MQTLNSDSQVQAPILVTGATGKTGHRVASRLEGLGFPVRRASQTRLGQRLYRMGVYQLEGAEQPSNTRGQRSRTSAEG